jgi:hypothetical protein
MWSSRTANNTSSHISRVLRYARPTDYGVAAATTAFGPGLLMLWERLAPSYVGKGGFPSVMRLCLGISAGAGFLVLAQRSTCTYNEDITRNSTNPFSAILWLDRKQTRDR